MKIKELYLPAYGCYTDFKLTLLENKPFCLIYGENETGKTTLHNAMLDFFYGIPAQTPYAYKHGTPAVGAQLLLVNGQTVAYIKRKGGRKLLDYPGVNCEDLTYVDKMPEVISKETFTSLFALDHKSLREGGQALASWQGSLAESMFTVASGINQLHQILDKLRKQQDEIYRPRGKKQQLNSLVSEYRNKLKEIKDAEARVDIYRECEKHFFASNSNLQILAMDINELRLYVKELERKIHLIPRVNLLRHKLEKRKAMGEVIYLPPTLREERIDAVKGLENAFKQQIIVKGQIDSLVKKMAAVDISKEILAEKVLIEQLNQGWGIYKMHQEELPGLIEERQSLENDILEIMKAINPEIKDLGAIETLRISLNRKEKIKTLITLKAALSSQIEKNQEQINAANSKLVEFKRQFDLLPAQRDISILSAIISEVQAEGEQEKNLITLQITLDNDKSLWAQKVVKLPLYTGTGENLGDIKLPMAETIRKWGQKISDQSLVIKNIQKEKDTIKLELQQIAKEIMLLDVDKQLHSEEDLYEARDDRELVWELVRRRLENVNEELSEEKLIGGQNLTVVYREKVETVDRIADSLWRNAELKHKWLLLHKQQAEKQLRLQEVIQDYEMQRENNEAIILEWQAEWSHVPLNNVLTPEEMQAWLINANEIIKDFQHISNTNSQVNALKNRIEMHKKAINKALAEIRFPPLDLSLTGMIIQCQKIINELNEIENQRRNIQARINEWEGFLREALQAEQGGHGKIVDWEKNWSDVTYGIAGSQVLQVENGEKYLQKLEEIVALDLKRTEKIQRVKQVEQKIHNFTTQLKEILAKVKNEWITLPIEKAWLDLYSLFQQVEKDHITFLEQDKQLKQKQAELQENEIEIQKFNLIIQGLLQLARCNSIEELLKQEEISYPAMQLDEEIEILQAEIQINKNESNFNEQELIELDIDRVAVELELKKAELVQLEEAQLKTTGSHAIIKARYNDMLSNTSERAARASQEAEEIQAKMHNLAEEYMKINLAYKLLEESIQVYSQKNKAAIIQRAGEIFSRLTLGSFKGIAVTSDNELAQILIGIRQTGEEVKLEAMSAGTLDQIYLTLRLAYIEEHLKNNEPLPVILDDLLINFDDQRSKETIKILMEISQYTQILFFTHNYHLLDIVKNASNGNLQIINLKDNLPA